jgi:RNA polymerase sigma-70 factor (ECF subfamily)
MGLYEATGGTDQLEAAAALEREGVVRLCARLTGDPDAAEDLAQDTLYEAWRNAHKLRDSDRRPQWLAGIARNVCRRWSQRRGKEFSLRTNTEGRSDPLCIEELADPALDLGADLDRDELADLLDRAMALLSPDSRTALVQHYIEEMPQSEVAARLGLTGNAVELRLRRGRRALKRVLTTELSQDAISFGLVQPDTEGWEQTRVWCPGCGERRLEGWLRPSEGKLYMRCSGCSSGDAHFIHSHLGEGLKDIRSYKPAVSRVLGVIHEMFRVRATGGAARCPGCGEWLPIARGAPPWVPPRYVNPDSIYLWHPRCGGADSETWHSLTWSLPEARRFWKENPRMRFVPEREVEFAGSPAVVTALESVTGTARLEVVSLRDTLEVVSINGNRPARHAQDG